MKMDYRVNNISVTVLYIKYVLLLAYFYVFHVDTTTLSPFYQ